MIQRNAVDQRERAPRLLGRLWRLLPSEIDRRVRFVAWATLVSQTLLVGTGGAVRLTGSGLGCPTWPRCTDDSFVSTPEMGIHGVIEFGNRLLTFVLVLVAIATFLAVVRLRRNRPELFRLSIAIGLGIPVQAVIGGVSVLTGLNPWIVGLHFVVSIVLVALSTVLVWRVLTGPRGSRYLVPSTVVWLVRAAGVTAALSIAAGIVTTGSGPHAGDSTTPRNGLNSEFMQHVHSWPAYALFAATLLIVVLTRFNRAVAPWAVALLAVELVQIAVGLAQARTGLPPLLVGIHMVLSCAVTAAVVALGLALRERPSYSSAAAIGSTPTARNSSVK